MEYIKIRKKEVKKIIKVALFTSSSRRLYLISIIFEYLELLF